MNQPAELANNTLLSMEIWEVSGLIRLCESLQEEARKRMERNIEKNEIWKGHQLVGQVRAYQRLINYCDKELERRELVRQKTDEGE